MTLVFGLLLVGLAAFLFRRAFSGWRCGEATISVPFWSLTARRENDPRAFPLAVAGNVLKGLVTTGLAIWLIFFPH